MQVYGVDKALHHHVHIVCAHQSSIAVMKSLVVLTFTLLPWQLPGSYHTAIAHFMPYILIATPQCNPLHKLLPTIESKSFWILSGLNEAVAAEADDTTSERRLRLMIPLVRGCGFDLGATQLGLLSSLDVDLKVELKCDNPLLSLVGLMCPALFLS